MSLSCFGIHGTATSWCSHSFRPRYGLRLTTSLHFCMEPFLSSSAESSSLLHFGCHDSSEILFSMEFIESLLLQKLPRYKTGSFQTQIFQEHEPQTHLVTSSPFPPARKSPPSLGAASPLLSLSHNQPSPS